MAEKFEIRLAEKSDVALVIRIVRRFRDHLGEHYPREDSIAASVEGLLCDPNTDFLIGMGQQGAVLGYVQLRYRVSLWNPGLEVQLDDLFVTPDARRKGLGEQLLQGALARAHARGGSLIGLNTNERNSNALRLYTRSGFTSERKRWGGRQLWLERSILCQAPDPEE